MIVLCTGLSAPAFAATDTVNLDDRSVRIPAGQLRSTAWQVFDNLVSPGGGLLFGHHPDGGLYSYVDGSPFDRQGNDIAGRGAADECGWTQTLLSAQPMRY